MTFFTNLNLKEKFTHFHPSAELSAADNSPAAAQSRARDGAGRGGVNLFLAAKQLGHWLDYLISLNFLNVLQALRENKMEAEFLVKLLGINCKMRENLLMWVVVSAILLQTHDGPCAWDRFRWLWSTGSFKTSLTFITYFALSIYGWMWAALRCSCDL